MQLTGASVEMLSVCTEAIVLQSAFLTENRRMSPWLSYKL